MSTKTKKQKPDDDAKQWYAGDEVLVKARVIRVEKSDLLTKIEIDVLDGDLPTVVRVWVSPQSLWEAKLDVQS